MTVTVFLLSQMTSTEKSQQRCFTCKIFFWTSKTGFNVLFNFPCFPISRIFVRFLHFVDFLKKKIRFFPIQNTPLIGSLNWDYCFAVNRKVTLNVCVDFENLHPYDLCFVNLRVGFFFWIIFCPFKSHCQFINTIREIRFFPLILLRFKCQIFITNLLIDTTVGCCVLYFLVVREKNPVWQFSNDNFFKKMNRMSHSFDKSIRWREWKL